MFNGFLFVMDIKLLMAHAIHFQAVADHTTKVLLQMDCSFVVVVWIWSNRFVVVVVSLRG